MDLLPAFFPGGVFRLDPKTDYSPTDLEPLRTRIEAFLEMMRF